MNSDLYILDELENLQEDEFYDEGKPFKSINETMPQLNYQSKASSKLFSSINQNDLSHLNDFDTKPSRNEEIKLENILEIKVK